MAVGYFGVYRGQVVNNVDPRSQGRLLITVPPVTGFRSSFWAEPSHPAGLPVLLPKPGDPVWVQFVGGDTMTPLWIGIPGASAFNGGTVGDTTTFFTAANVGDLTVTGTVTVPDASIPVSKISGLTTALSDYVTLDTTQTITGAKTFTGIVTAPRFVATTPDIGGSAAADFGSGTQHFYVRPRSGGGIEFVNSAFTAVVASISDSGALAASGYVTASAGAQVSTKSNGGSGDALRISDSVSGKYAHLRARGGGGIEWINQAFSAPFLYSDDTGNLVAAGTISDTSGRVYSPGNANLASTVVAATAFGAASAVGTGTAYARSDHTHGTPASPVTSAVAGSGISVSAATGAVTIANTGVISLSSGTGNTAVNLGGGLWQVNSTGVTSLTQGTGISLNGSTGGVTISNAGVTSVAGRAGTVTLTAADIGAGSFPSGAAYTMSGQLWANTPWVSSGTAGTPAIRFGGRGVLGSDPTGGGGTTAVGDSIYWNGSAWSYLDVTTNRTSLLQLNDGSLYFFNAPANSGAAGAAATMTQRFAVDPNGNATAGGNLRGTAVYDNGNRVATQGRVVGASAIGGSAAVNSTDINGQSLNQNFTTGVYNGSSTTNNPWGSDTRWLFLQVFAHENTTLWQRQVVYDMTGGTDIVYTRRGSDNGSGGINWSGWVAINGMRINQTIRGTLNSSYSTAVSATIASVNMANTQVRHVGGYGSTSSGTGAGIVGSITLASATSVTFSPGGGLASGNSGSYDITEWI